MKSGKNAFVNIISRVIDDMQKTNNINQVEVGKRLNIAQKNISNIINMKKDPTIEKDFNLGKTVDSAANSLNIPSYKLLIPDLKLVDLYDKKLDELVSTYVMLSAEGRENLAKMVKKELAFETLQKIAESHGKYNKT